MSIDNPRPSFWLSPNGIAAILFIGAVGYFLLNEHREHVYQWLPWLIFALCPLLHIFMHGRHGHGHGDDHDQHDHSKHKQDE